MTSTPLPPFLIFCVGGGLKKRKRARKARKEILQFVGRVFTKKNKKTKLLLLHLLFSFFFISSFSSRRRRR